MHRIDAHAHFSKFDSKSAGLLRELDLKLLNICVDFPNSDCRSQVETYRGAAARHPDRFAWCTTFRATDPTDRVIAEMERDFEAGAVACKVWKNVGMDLKKQDGSYLMLDDPTLTPVFSHLERSGRTLIIHAGEPKACWQPLDPKSPHRAYYSTHPEWHMHGRTDVPTHEAITASRDHLLERHPKLRVVGAHLGSLEHDLPAISERLERFPNFAVDTAERLGDLEHHDRETVRNFFAAHSDRILFGSDLQDDLGSDAVRTRYEKEFAFFGEAALALPAAIEERFFLLNAQTWFPGIDQITTCR